MSMQSFMSMQSALKQASIQGSARKQTESQSRIIKAELKQVGGDTQERRERLHKLEAKADTLSKSQMTALGELNKQMNETAKQEREEAKKAEAKKNAETRQKAGNRDKVELHKTNKNDDTDGKEKSGTASEETGGIYDAQGVVQGAVQVVAETIGTGPFPAEQTLPVSSVDVRV